MRTAAVLSSLRIRSPIPRDLTRGTGDCDDILFSARHLPLARATSFESWLDLSGVSHRRAGFFRAKCQCAMVLTLGGVMLALQRA
jgi:hypothetical protein